MKYLRIFPILLAGIFAHVQVATAAPMTALDLFAAKVAASHTVMDMINAMDLSSQKRDDLMKTARRRNAEHMSLPAVEVVGDSLHVKSSAGGTPLRIEIVDAAARSFKINGQALTLNEKWNSEQILNRLERIVQGDQTISFWDLALPKAEAAGSLVMLLVGLAGLAAVVAWGKGVFKDDLAEKIIKVTESSGLKMRLKTFSCAEGRLSEFAIEKQSGDRPSQTASFDYETPRNGTIKYSADDVNCNFAWSGSNYSVSDASAVESSPAANEFCQGLVKDSKGSYVSARQLEIFAAAGLETLRNCAADAKCCKQVQAHIQSKGGAGTGSGRSGTSN